MTLMSRVHGASSDYLLIDISNSFTKVARSTRKRLMQASRTPTASLTPQFLRKLLRTSPVRRIIVSSVVPEKTRVIYTAAAKVPVLQLTPKLDLGVGIDYPAPETIGADRLANAAAVAELSGYPAVVVDFGTAVTFDIVSETRSYIGGVIAPGLEAMTSFLYQRTALLPRIELREPRRVVGRSTREAMLSGAIFGYRGLVRELLQLIAAECFARENPRVIATGGYARLMAAGLPLIEEVHENLTLEGLRLIANRNVAAP